MATVSKNKKKNFITDTLNTKNPRQMLSDAAPQPKETQAAPEIMPNKEVTFEEQESVQEYPTYNTNIKFNDDNTVTFTHGNFIKNMTKDQYNAYLTANRGTTNSKESEQANKFLPDVQDLIDYEAVQRGLFSDAKKKLPGYITNQGQLDIYNKIGADKRASIEAEIRAIAEREGAKGVDPLQTSGSGLQTAGFMGSGVVGSLGAAGTAGAAAGALGIGTGLAATGPIGWAALGIGALGAAGAWMANQGKNRDQDILNGKSISQQSQKYINLYKTEALNPNADKDQLISDYYDMKRQVYASYNLLHERSLFDTTFRVNQGADELAKIKIWMANEDNLDQEFFTNLANANAETYNARMPIALQQLNQGATNNA